MLMGGLWRLSIVSWGGLSLHAVDTGAIAMAPS
ncbi:hypothetical protein BH10PLA2_BH10PLA2_37840 [soil metagenome]